MTRMKGGMVLTAIEARTQETAGDNSETTNERKWSPKRVLFMVVSLKREECGRAEAEAGGSDSAVSALTPDTRTYLPYFESRPDGAKHRAWGHGAYRVVITAR